LSAQAGLAGLVLIKGTGPFSVGLDSGNPTDLATPVEWARQFVATGNAQNWTTQIVWYRIASR
jgi:hypothetical protein